MTGTYVTFVQGLLHSVFADCLAFYPQLKQSFERDEHHLLRQVETRGLNVLTIELPDFCKHFDMCLSKEQFSPMSLPQGRIVSRRHRYPRLFSGLMQLIFDDCGLLKNTPDEHAAFLIRCLCNVAKKLPLDCEPSRVYSTVEEFYQDEEDLPVPTLSWDGDGPFRVDSYRDISFADAPLPLFEPGTQAEYDRRTGSSRALTIMQHVADRVVSSLGEFIPGEWKGRHGPGAVSDRFELSKFEFPQWSARLNEIFDLDEFGFPTLSIALGCTEWSDVSDTPVFWGDRPSKLMSVPKTMKAPRLIASEPIAGQYTQQIIRSFLKARLRRSLLSSSVRIEDQSHSRELALKASLTGELATIDLKAASDRMSCWVVERLFRRNRSVSVALRASRTSALVQTLDKCSPSEIRLKKFAPMGSAVTFPVQSIFYAVASITAVLIENGWAVRTKNIRKAAQMVCVYGDDLIVPVSVADTLINLLECMWFKVNRKKTFTEGNFRESCGVDAFRGFDITPAYSPGPVDANRFSTVISALSCSNNFFMKGLWHSAAFLETTIPRWVRNHFPVVRYGADPFGLVAFTGSAVDKLVHRWNPDLQREEVKVAFLHSKVTKTVPKWEHSLFQWFSEAPDPEVLWVAGQVSSKTARMRFGWRPVEDYADSSSA